MRQVDASDPLSNHKKSNQILNNASILAQIIRHPINYIDEQPSA